MRVLVAAADDTPTLVRQLGHEVLNVSTDDQAIENADNWKPDLLLVDLTQFNGIELARQIKANACAAPLVGICGFMDVARRREAIDAGCDEFLAKPFRFNELAGMLARLQARIVASRAIAERTRVIAQMTRELNRKTREGLDGA